MHRIALPAWNSDRLVPFCLSYRLAQGGSEKLGDEDLEMVLDKLVRLLAYISGGCGGRHAA